MIRGFSYLRIEARELANHFACEVIRVRQLCTPQ
jgi:hypothetical protein